MGTFFLKNPLPLHVFIFTWEEHHLTVHFGEMQNTENLGCSEGSLLYGMEKELNRTFSSKIWKHLK